MPARGLSEPVDMRSSEEVKRLLNGPLAAMAWSPSGCSTGGWGVEFDLRRERLVLQYDGRETSSLHFFCVSERQLSRALSAVWVGSEAFGERVAAVAAGDVTGAGAVGTVVACVDVTGLVKIIPFVKGWGGC